MNVMLYIYYCCCSLDHIKIDLITNNYSEELNFDENSFSATDYQIADLLGDKVEAEYVSHFSNYNNLDDFNFINEINNNFIDSIPNTRDNIKDQYKKISDQYINICHDHQYIKAFYDHQKINCKDNKYLKNIDNKTGFDEQQKFIIEISPNFEISNIFFSDKIASAENQKLKRKLLYNKRSILKTNQQFLKQDINKQKHKTNEPNTEQIPYGKNDCLISYNTASTSNQYFEDLNTDDDSKRIKRSLETNYADISNINNVYKSINNNKELETLLYLLEFRNINKLQQCEVGDATIIAENMNTADNYENADSISIVDAFDNLFNKINLEKSTNIVCPDKDILEYCDIIQQDLILTLRNTFKIIYEENEYINEQIKKLENLKKISDAILRIKDTVHILQELLNVEINVFKRNQFQSGIKIK